jgi:hypothetical protein
MEWTLRPRGAGRWLSAAFLSFWLLGWLAGELFAIAAVAALTANWLAPGFVSRWIRGDAPPPQIAYFAVPFLLLWLIIWTVGGLRAVKELFRLIGGEERVRLEGETVHVERRAGPFVERKELPVSDLKRLKLTLGSEEERRAVIAELRSLAGPAADRQDARPVAPDGWTEEIDATGAPVLRAGTWLSYELRAEPSALDVRRRLFGRTVSQRRYDQPRIAVRRGVDSDGDAVASVTVNGHTLLPRSLDVDRCELVGQWLAARTGVALHDES